jgi:hypothetical protein
MLKSCTKCGASKPLDEFSADHRRPGGVRSQCKACKSVAFRKWSEANRERRAASFKAWGEANRERRLDYMKSYNAKTAPRKAKWLRERREQEREYRREYRAKRNPAYLIRCAKNAISMSTGVPVSQIPTSLAEAKAAQLAVVRETSK